MPGSIVVPAMNVDQKKHRLPGFALDPIDHLPELPITDEIPLIIHFDVPEEDAVLQRLDGQGLGLTVAARSGT
jgi:hypothetical protein